VSATPTLYDAIGGAPAVRVVVDKFYERLTVDPLVRHHFDPDRMESLRDGQVRWFTACLSGEDLASDLADAHAHLTITDQQVTAVIGHLDAVLGQVGLDRRSRRAVVTTVSRLWHARQF
jgi:hemoglobin